MSFKNPEDPLQFLVENHWNKEKGFNVEKLTTNYNPTSKNEE